MLYNKLNPIYINRRYFSITNLRWGQNIIEKITQRYVLGDHKVKSGDFVTICPHKMMTHDNTGAVINKFNSIGLNKVYDNKQLVFTLDHDVQNTSETNLLKYKKIEQFAKKYNIDFYPAGSGIGHQIMIEQGYALPYTLTVASDSHSNMYGGVGCLGTPLVRTDAAAVWSTGKTWWQVPKVIKIEFINELKEGVTGKDVIISLCSLFNKDQVLNCIIEVVGKANLSIDDRLTISNMSTEWGALGMVFPVDEITLDYYKQRINKLGDQHQRINKKLIQSLQEQPLIADKDAYYTKSITLDLSTIEPYASGPNSVTVASSIKELEKQKIKINKAYLLSCTNSRLSDIKQAAKILKGNKVKDGVELYVAAASLEVQKEAENQGDWEILLNAGAIPLPSGCGACVGLGKGLLKDNEVGISASNRNFKGRMGSKKALAYLASPAVVAASSIKGYISLPEGISTKQVSAKFDIVEQLQSTSTQTTNTINLIPGFPKYIEGNILYLGNKDSLNTDGIYAGKHTYNDNLTMQQMRLVAMENFDPMFLEVMKEGDILIGGYNFGTGSSREQAATVFKACKIQAIIAASFSETYKRNAINNGVLVIVLPELINYLRTLTDPEVINTVRLEHKIKIDFENCKVNVVDGSKLMKQFDMQPISVQQQELVVLDGLENWVRKQDQT